MHLLQSPTETLNFVQIITIYVSKKETTFVRVMTMDNKLYHR